MSIFCYILLISVKTNGHINFCKNISFIKEIEILVQIYIKSRFPQQIYLFITFSENIFIKNQFAIGISAGIPNHLCPLLVQCAQLNFAMFLGIFPYIFRPQSRLKRPFQRIPWIQRIQQHGFEKYGYYVTLVCRLVPLSVKYKKPCGLFNEA